jgi:hypothetical protein
VERVGEFHGVLTRIASHLCISWGIGGIRSILLGSEINPLEESSFVLSQLYEVLHYSESTPKNPLNISLMHLLNDLK